MIIAILGHTVEYLEHIAQWRWRDDNGIEIFSDPQLTPVRLAIEKHEKKLEKQAKEKFVEWTALLEHWEGVMTVQVISECDEGHVWVRHLSKRRSKEPLSKLVRVTESVASLYDQYLTLCAEKERFSKQAAEVKKTIFKK